MVVPSTFSNVIIEGNTIDLGSSSSGNTPTFYTYGGPGSVPGQDGYLLLTNADCRIFGNYFSGITSNPTNNYMLGLFACSCNIQGNTFVRGASEISAYIISTGNFDHMITGNIFDGYTVDGSTPQATAPLVTGTTANTLYTNNKNQVGYAIVPLSVNNPTLYALGTPGSTEKAITSWFNYAGPNVISGNAYVTSGVQGDAMVTKIFDAEASPAGQHFSITTNLSGIVPIGAKIIDAKVAIYNPSGATITLSAADFMTLTLNKSYTSTNSINIVTFPSTSTSNWTIAYSSSTTFTCTVGSELYPTAKVLEIPTLNYNGTVINNGGSSSLPANSNISTNYVADGNSTLLANLLISFTASATGNTSAPLLLVSPLIITYVF